MKIIDFRYRPSTKETIDGVLNNPVYAEYCKRIPFKDTPIKSFELAMQELKELGVQHAVVVGRDIETTYNAAPSNKEVLSFIERAPLQLIGFYGIDPHKGMKSYKEMKEFVMKEGFKGASIDPGMSKLTPDNALYYPFYALCCDFNIPITITTGLSPYMQGVKLDCGNPLYIDTVAQDFPELRIVVSHASYPWVTQALALSFRNPNVYIDLSTIEHWPQAQDYITAIEKSHSEKVVFSSANPFVDINCALKSYEALPFTGTVRSNIMYNNAARILNL